jgi:hypothetical protein
MYSRAYNREKQILYMFSLKNNFFFHVTLMIPILPPTTRPNVMAGLMWQPSLGKKAFSGQG